MNYQEIKINGSTYFLGEDGWVYVQLDNPKEIIWCAYSIQEVENE